MKKLTKFVNKINIKIAYKANNSLFINTTNKLVSHKKIEYIKQNIKFCKLLLFNGVMLQIMLLMYLQQI